MISRIIYLGVCGLFLAGIVHILVIFLIPTFGSKDAARQIMSQSKPLQFSELTEGKLYQIADIDPFFTNYVCRFDLSGDAVLISGDKRAEFWSASIFDERGRVIYSLNDRTAIKNQLKVLIVSPIHLADIRQTQPEEVETSILVETAAQPGFIVLRALIREPSQETDTKAFLDSATCQNYITR